MHLDILKQEAQQAMTRRDYAQAIPLLSQAIEQERDNPDLYLNRGLAHHMRQNYALATQDFTAVLALDAQNLDALLWRAEAYLQQGQPEQAQHDYSEYIALQPDDASEVYANRARLFAQKGDLENAIRDYTQAIRTCNDAQLGKLYFSRATLYYAQERYAQAREDCTQAIANKYHSPDVYDARGSASVALGDLTGALADYLHATDLDRRHINAHYNAGVIHYQLSHYEQAIPHCSAVIKIQPSYLEAFYVRGMCYLALRQSREARSDFAQVLKLNAQHHAAMHHRGHAYRLRGDYAKARQDYEGALRLMPRQALYLTRLAELDILQEDILQAHLRLKQLSFLVGGIVSMSDQALLLWAGVARALGDSSTQERLSAPLHTRGIQPPHPDSAPYGWEQAIIKMWG